MAGGPGADLVLHVVVAAPPAVRRPEDLRALFGGADLIELRLDLLLDEPTPEAVAAWVAAAPRPVLATVRSRAQGGRFPGGAARAAAVLETAARAGAAWIDAEADVLAHLGPASRAAHVLTSVHGDGPCPPAPGRTQASGGTVLCKLARPVDDGVAWERLRALASPEGAGRAFLVPYGRLGAARGAFVGPGRPGLLFGSAGASSAVVAGQPPLAALLDDLRAGEVGPQVALYGLLGRPPAPSPSPALHNAVFRAEGREALYVPLPDLEPVGARAFSFAGLSVTHPHKLEAARQADELSDDARACGAVNTLLPFDGGARWRGENTDVRALRALVPSPARGAGAFVYGAGGFARAAVGVLRESGYAVRLGARDEGRGRAVADALRAAWGGLTFARADGDALVLNATGAGVDTDGVEAFASTTLKGLTVLDAPYARGGAATALARQALRQGAARVVDGRELLIEQALYQARLFGATTAGDATLRELLAFASESQPILVLLGVRGSGKTRVGARVARLLGRPFVDLDAEVERITGRAPAAWIDTDGWEAFRREECRALERALARRGAVLATGGGTVEWPSSRALLAGAGVNVHLRVPPERAAARVEADAAPRPRWPGARDALDEARLLVARRTAWWSALAEHVVDASGTVDEVASDVARRWMASCAERAARESEPPIR